MNTTNDAFYASPQVWLFEGWRSSRWSYLVSIGWSVARESIDTWESSIVSVRAAEWI